MKRTISTILLIFILIVAFSTSAALMPTTPFQVVWDEEPSQIESGEDFELAVTIRMPEGHYLYADDTELDFTSLDGLLIEEVKYPEPTLHDDDYQGGSVKVYEGDLRITITGRVPETLDLGEHDLVAKLKFRGCSPKICFRPEVKELPFLFEVVGVKDVLIDDAKVEGEVERTDGEEVLPKGRSDSTGIISRISEIDLSVLMGQSIFISLLMVFLAGILTSLTPCVWPIIPLVLTFIGVHPHKRFRENLLLAASLTAGLILVYAILGLIAVAVGKNLGFLFQQRWFLALVVIFFVAMSLSMFGVFDIQLPKKWQGLLHGLGGEGYRGAFLAGMGTGLVASPCSGPVIAALLGYVALKHDYFIGFLLLIVYGLGMSLIILLLGTLYGELVGRLKSGVWMLWVRRALGIMLLFPAFFYMGTLFGWTPEVSFSDHSAPRVEWLDSERDALKFAEQSGRPVMIEFTANWCPPCRALERGFFRRPEVVKLSYQLVPFRVDATVETEKIRELINRYGVMGWPTVIFLTPDGKRYTDLRIGDYAPDLIEKNMRRAIERSKK